MTMTRIQRVNLSEKFSLFDDIYVPRIIGELNGQLVKVVKFQGPYVWHDHENEDELFLVVKGRMRIEFRDQTVELEEGELVVVPRGVEHRPVADSECWIVLFEPKTTVNTGRVKHAYTRTQLEKI
jgi:mannose-6-phosphate isomerase-like protein (cupin superfamily)